MPLELLCYSLQGLLGPDPKVLNDILAALWSGLKNQMAGKARDAGGDAFSECLVWALSQVLCCAGVSMAPSAHLFTHKTFSVC